MPEQLTELRDRIRDFIADLIPGDLEAYIPGQKFVAGAILWALAQGFGIGAEQVVDIPVLGELSVSELAILVGVWIWPPQDRDHDLSEDEALELALADEPEADDADENVPTRKRKGFHA